MNSMSSMNNQTSAKTMHSIYRAIAKKHGVSVAEVKKEMQQAIASAYQNPNQSSSEKAERERIPRREEIPETEEFLKYIVQEWKTVLK